MLATLYDWDSRQKLYLATRQVSRGAEIWCGGSCEVQVGWDAFAFALVDQFPFEPNFGRCLEEAIDSTSPPGRDLQTCSFLRD